MPTVGQENTFSMFLAHQWRFRQFAAQRGDVLVALGVAVPVIGSLAVRAIHSGQPLVLLLSLGALAPIFLRRSRPGAALLLAVAVEAAIPDNRALLLPVMAVLYTIAAQAPWKTAAAAGTGAAVATIIAGAVSGSGSLTEHGGLLGYAIGSAASCAAAVAAGLYVGARRRVLDSLRERAERLHRERELLADRAVGQERIRIAQELHDIVAHNVSLMVVEAQALGATVHDDRVSQSTDAIADLGRQAMTEMHTTLRLLRGDGDTPELTPQPGLAQLERLLEQLRRAGLEIQLTVEGQPRPLSRSVDLSAFRIIQEALTNVLKHAAGASTEVTLAYKSGGLELTIVDSGDETPAPLRREPSDGHGVIGMRERATLFGGTLTTKALPGGFKVTATLPYAPTAS
jgi:signal transduction histidine kinase